MILISVQELQKSFGVHEVLRSVTFSLQKGEKMGLVGVNGCGKTTLMRMIAGEMQPDGGTIHRNKDLRVGYLAQLDDIPLTDTVWGALLKVFEPIRVMERRMAEIETSIYRLAQAIKKSQKRANALKNIVIPDFDSTIRVISEALEEKEREEFVRMKVIKKQNGK